MSVAISSMVFDCCPYGGNLGLLARSLADSCPDHTGEKMFRAVETLAHTSCQNARTVQRGLARMVQDGWLIMVRRGGGFRGASSEYKINPAWLYAVQQERALAAQTNSLPRKIGVLHNLPLRDEAGEETGEVMGDRLSPITMDNSCLNIEHIHDKNASIHDKNASIDDTAVSPKHEHEHNTPLPPTGGETGFENLKTKEGEGNQARTDFAQVLAAYPKKDTADAAKAWRAYQSLEQRDGLCNIVLALIAYDARTIEAWARDDGRWVPKLSKWLQGFAMLGRFGLPTQAAEVPAVLRGAVSPGAPPSVTTPLPVPACEATRAYLAERAQNTAKASGPTPAQRAKLQALRAGKASESGVPCGAPILKAGACK